MHVCMEFVPDRDYPYLLIGARGVDGFVSGSVLVDGFRLSAYQPLPDDYLWEFCASMPLDRPFP